MNKLSPQEHLNQEFLRLFMTFIIKTNIKPLSGYFSPGMPVKLRFDFEHLSGPRVWVIYEWPFLNLHALKIRKV
jgi:hypothetical protein